ncbi:MAG: hypothetical protein AAFU64_04640 [Bacteroidota bacterium]
MNTKLLILAPLLLLWPVVHSPAQSLSKSLEVVLIGRWEMDMSHWKGQMQKKFKAERPKELDTLSEAQWQQMMDHLLDKASPSWIIFKVDRTYDYFIHYPTGKQKVDQGTWEINYGHLFISQEMGVFKGLKEKMKIEELNKERLVISTENEPGTLSKWVFHRINE